jgi:hypothetical protein
MATTNHTLRLPRTTGAAILALGMLAGCSVGPKYIETSRTRYNRAVQVTAGEEMLLNIVRSRYADPPEFLALSGITSQFETEASGGFGTEFGLGNARVSGGLKAADRPTVTLTPLQDENFTKRFLTPVGIESVYLFSRNGRELDRVLRLAVESVNGVENAPHRAGTGEQPDAGPFLWAGTTLGELARRRRVEVAYQEKDEEVSHALDPASVRGRDVVAAAEKGFRFRRSGLGPVVLTQKTREAVLRFAPDVANSPEVLEIERVLNLKPGRASYVLKAGAEGQLGDNPTGREEIVVSTRSVEQILHFVSGGVDVPPGHVEKGLAEPAGCAGPTDLIRVRVSKMRPCHAAVAVRHRGHWFYIDDADRTSKETFELLLELYNLETRGGGATNIPLLTLNAGR